ncbi:MAG TPA: very short patch repair endonuclease [Devosiaceae bacterium]|jgi:DNA mismatch endonuclease (patch repair protein)
MDVLTPTQRRFNMSRIRSTDTKPELLLRKALFARGFRYRLNVKSLPGKPDLVFRQFAAIIMVHGCFWHGHGDCVRYRPPLSQLDYWDSKIARNQQRDLQTVAELSELGWRVMTIWECALVGKFRLSMDAVVTNCEVFLRSEELSATLRSEQ